MIRKAKIADIKQVYNLIMEFANKEKMLPRSLSELYDNLRDFFVFEKAGKIFGCCALHVVWEDLGEIRSLAVKTEEQGKGIGAKLVEACIEEMSQIGLSKVFALTYKPEFFEKKKFFRIDRAELPHKIWADCIKCPKFPDCGEVPVMYKVKTNMEVA
ncbi:N-acetyltransferase [bacterium]|nr:N-acetyltransferase [bacterium]